LIATVVDTSALLMLFDSDEPRHQDASGFFADVQGPLVVSPYVIAEIDYLVGTRFGTAAEISVLRELASGAWDLAAMDHEDLTVATDVVERYGDQSVGIADASLVALAARHGTDRIATSDHRHFSVLRTLDGRPFTLLP
jgi:hypothetical protein